VTFPGMPSGVPSGPGLGWINEQFAQIRAQLRTILPSAADTVRPIVQDLVDKQAQLEAQQDTLEEQQADLNAAQEALELLVSGQVQPDTAYAWTQNFAITSATTVYASVTKTVPAGYSRAMVAMVGTAMGFNGSGASAWLYAAPTLTGATGGSEVYTGVANSGGTSIASPYFTLLTGLTGGTSTITLGTQMRVSGATWPASTGNVARVDALLLYLR